MIMLMRTDPFRELDRLTEQVVLTVKAERLTSDHTRSRSPTTATARRSSPDPESEPGGVCAPPSRLGSASGATGVQGRTPVAPVAHLLSINRLGCGRYSLIQARV
jgi:hypothetical protein